MSKERGGSLIFLLVGIYGLLYSAQLPLGKWNEPGPGIFPLSLSILLFVSGTLGLFFMRQREKIDIKWGEILRKLGAPSIIVVLTAAFILTVDRLGYLLAAAGYLFLLFYCVSRYRLWISIGLAIILGAGSWYLFVRFLSVQLPRGGVIPL